MEKRHQNATLLIVQHLEKRETPGWAHFGPKRAAAPRAKMIQADWTNQQFRK